MNTHSPPYIGRFAPSPTGPLHMGSLVAALASYFDARAANGQWLVRVEDIDPPREVSGSTVSILKSLEAHQLFWDGEILYQHTRLGAYAERLEQLQALGLLYPCYCTRHAIRDMGPAYNGHCRDLTPKQLESNAAKPAALRVKVQDLPEALAHLECPVTFTDFFMGSQSQYLPDDVGDFILRRKDQLFAYQLAVVCDDIAQGITHVVRGSDLLSSTARQIFLFHLFEATPPAYGHIPLMVDRRGDKLSKQTHAPAIDDSMPEKNLLQAMSFLGLDLSASLMQATAEELLQWGVKHWERGRVPAQMTRPQ